MAGILRHQRTKILVPVNGKPASDHAFRRACQLVRQCKGELYVIYVFEPPMKYSLGYLHSRRSHEEGEAILARMERIAHSEKCKVNATLLEARNAGPAITLEANDRDMDLVVIGLPYQRRIDYHALGVTADYLLKNVNCEVLICREPFVAPAAPGPAAGRG